MAQTIEDIIKRDAQPCACKRSPAWAKLKGGPIVLACPNMDCGLFLAVKGHTVTDAVKTWNTEVKRYAQQR